ncbi:MAG: hypothetical protein R3C59_30655 [Planctomycetaceae bacterium]
MKIAQDLVHATLLVCSCCLVIDAVAVAQSRDRRRDDDVPSSKTLELRLEKAEAALVDEYKLAAEEFHKQGDKEKAMAMLERLKQLSPQLEGLDRQIKAIGEELMQENADDIDIDTRLPEWKLVGNVMEGKAFRLQAAGEYKMTYMTTVGVDGVKPDKDAKDYNPGVPLGCLLGVIVSDNKDGKAEAGKPFPVNAQLEHTPKESGKLFLKVNVPEGTKCVGKIKVHLSGYIDTGKRR